MNDHNRHAESVWRISILLWHVSARLTRMAKYNVQVLNRDVLSFLSKQIRNISAVRICRNIILFLNVTFLYARYIAVYHSNAFLWSLTVSFLHPIFGIRLGFTVLFSIILCMVEDYWWGFHIRIVWRVHNINSTTF